MEYTPKYDKNYFKPYTDKPIIGQKDPWFNVTGAIDGNGKEYSVDKGNAYVVENGKISIWIHITVMAIRPFL